MKSTRMHIGLVLGIGTVVLVGLIVGFRWKIAPAMVPEGSGIPMDDFTFYAGDVVAQDKVGSVSAPAGKCFYLVTARLVNHAKRVDFDFQPAIYSMLTLGGEPLGKASEAQAELDKSLGANQLSPVSVGPNGDSATSHLVFEGPKGLKQVRVSVEEGGWVGVVLEGVFFGNKNYLLNVKER